MTYDEFCDQFGIETMRSNPAYRVLLEDGTTIVAIPPEYFEQVDYHAAECGIDNIWTVIPKAEDEPDDDDLLPPPDEIDIDSDIDTEDDEESYDDDLPYTESDPETDDPSLETVEVSCVSGIEVHAQALFFFVTDEPAEEPGEQQFTLTFTG